VSRFIIQRAATPLGLAHRDLTPKVAEYGNLGLSDAIPLGLPQTSELRLTGLRSASHHASLFTDHESLITTHFFIAEACGSRETRESSSSLAIIWAALTSAVSESVSTRTSGATGAS